LVATAAIQFADGNAATIVTSDAWNNFDEYKRNAEKAMTRLESMSDVP
jgi:hypothetical protein